VVLFRELGLDLVCLGQLRVDVHASSWGVGVRSAPGCEARSAPSFGVSPSPAPPRSHRQPGRRQQPRSTRVLGHSFQCWSRRSSRTSSFVDGEFPST
jgi:hypothetical protein